MNRSCQKLVSETAIVTSHNTVVGLVNVMLPPQAIIITTTNPSRERKKKEDDGDHPEEKHCMYVIAILCVCRHTVDENRGSRLTDNEKKSSSEPQ